MIFSIINPSKCAVYSSATQIQENLCYLSSGGSSETFTINEAVPVGSIIGILKVSYKHFYSFSHADQNELPADLILILILDPSSSHP